MDSDDDQFSGESWKENSEKPSIVKNLMGQEEKATQTYPRSSLKVLTALELEPNCGDPLIAANLLPGAARGVIADSVAAFLIFIRTRYSMFEARQWEEEHLHGISPVFRDLHF